MTDRELLINIKTWVDAQLLTNVIPVLQPPVQPPPVQPLPPAPLPPPVQPGGRVSTGSPVARTGSTTTITIGSQSGDPLEWTEYDINALNTPRRFTNGNNTHFITPDRNGVVILHSGKMGQNVPDVVKLYVFGPGVSESMDLPTTDQTFQFNVAAGVRYGITVSSPDTFALEIRAELA